MSVTFLARPITDASAEELAWAHELHAWLVAHGAGVRFGGDTDATFSREVADSNVAAIVSARALVAILPGRLDVLSSVWVEIGIAIGAGVPVALVRPSVGDIEVISVPLLIDGLRAGSVPWVVDLVGTSPSQAGQSVLAWLQHFASR